MLGYNNHIENVTRSINGCSLFLNVIIFHVILYIWQSRSQCEIFEPLANAADTVIGLTHSWTFCAICHYSARRNCAFETGSLHLDCLAY